jgi:hypothetical protein
VHSGSTRLDTAVARVPGPPERHNQQSPVAPGPARRKVVFDRLADGRVDVQGGHRAVGHRHGEPGAAAAERFDPGAPARPTAAAARVNRRDANTAARHAGLNWAIGYQVFGKSLLGVEERVSGTV